MEKNWPGTGLAPKTKNFSGNFGFPLVDKKNDLSYSKYEEKMLREIVRSQKNELTIKIPNEYLNKELEVVILPLESKKKSLAGIFKHYSNQRLIKKETEIAWERAMKEKHDLS